MRDLWRHPSMISWQAACETVPPGCRPRWPVRARRRLQAPMARCVAARQPPSPAGAEPQPHSSAATPGRGAGQCRARRRAMACAAAGCRWGRRRGAQRFAAREDQRQTVGIKRGHAERGAPMPLKTRRRGWPRAFWIPMSGFCFPSFAVSLFWMPKLRCPTLRHPTTHPVACPSCIRQ